MQDQRHAALVVRDAQPVSPAIRNPERLIGEPAAQIDRVHVGQQQDAPAPPAAKPPHHTAADLVRRIDHDVRVVVGDQLHLSPQRAQMFGDDAGDLPQPLRVTAAGLD